MSIFSFLKDLFNNDTPDMSGPVPGAMGVILARVGIHELGPNVRKGIPQSVLAGCQKKIVLVPGARKLAYTKDGKPLMARTKRGASYHVMDNYGISVQQWKQRVNDEKRTAAGRWYSGKPA